LVFIAPGDYHTTIVCKQGGAQEKVISLNQNSPIWGVRPSADVLFFSVAECYGENAIGIVLTGMGKDGAQGLKAIREAGGKTIVQSPETALITGMPKAAIKTGFADHILPFDKISEFILRQL